MSEKEKPASAASLLFLSSGSQCPFALTHSLIGFLRYLVASAGLGPAMVRGTSLIWAEAVDTRKAAVNNKRILFIKFPLELALFNPSVVVLIVSCVHFPR